MIKTKKLKSETIQIKDRLLIRVDTKNINNNRSPKRLNIIVTSALEKLRKLG